MGTNPPAVQVLEQNQAPGSRLCLAVWARSRDPERLSLLLHSKCEELCVRSKPRVRCRSMGYKWIWTNLSFLIFLYSYFGTFLNVLFHSILCLFHACTIISSWEISILKFLFPIQLMFEIIFFSFFFLFVFLCLLLICLLVSVFAFHIRCLSHI